MSRRWHSLFKEDIALEIRGSSVGTARERVFNIAGVSVNTGWKLSRKLAGNNLQGPGDVIAGPAPSPNPQNTERSTIFHCDGISCSYCRGVLFALASIVPMKQTSLDFTILNARKFPLAQPQPIHRC